MKTTIFAVVCCVVFAIVAFGKERAIDKERIDVTTPGVAGKSFQVIAPEDLKQLWTEGEQLKSIQQQLAELSRNISDLQKDVRELMQTNAVVTFVVKVLGLFIPGMLVTAFGLWYADYLKRKPKKKTA